MPVFGRRQDEDVIMKVFVALYAGKPLLGWGGCAVPPASATIGVTSAAELAPVAMTIVFVVWRHGG